VSNLTDATDAAIADVEGKLSIERASAAAQIAADADVIASLQGQHAGDAQTIGELTGALTGAEQTIATLQARIAELEGGEPPPPPPPPPPAGALIGATCGSNDGGLNITADIRRTYNAGALPADFGGDASSADASRRAVKGGIVWTSYKGPMSDAALRAALKSMADYLTGKGQSGWVTFEHEPDIKGAIPLPTYHGGYDQLERIIAEFPILKPRVCLTGYTGDKDPTIWETYYRPTHDVIGFDHYNKGHQQTGEPFSVPADNWGKLIAFAKGKGKKAAIGETGVGTDAVAGPVIKTRADWYKAHREFALDPANDLVAACAFDSGLGLLDAASAHAWFGV
jgi:hypothetical protein